MAGFDSVPEATPYAAAGSFGTAPWIVRALTRASQVREYRPHIIITYDEIGGYPHPDHIMTHKGCRGSIQAAKAYVGEE